MNFSQKFAVRLNSFKPESSKPNNIWSFEEIGKAITVLANIPGLTHLDLNFPDHLTDIEPNSLKSLISHHGLKLNGLAMRYSGNKIFENGAFIHPNIKVRKQAMEFTLKAIDILTSLNGNLLTVWLGQDGYNYPFEIDYQESYRTLVKTFRRIAQYKRNVKISFEYKPLNPKTYTILPTMDATLLLIRDIGLPNIGATLDFCHSLSAHENPAQVASMALGQNLLYGVHLNDGHGLKDDGLPVGSVHLAQTIELLYVLARGNYKGVIYFDTFPEGINPIEECKANIRTVTEINRLLKNISYLKLTKYLKNQEVVSKNFLRSGVSGHLSKSLDNPLSKIFKRLNKDWRDV